MKTTHRFWQLTVFSFLMVLCVLYTAEVRGEDIPTQRFATRGSASQTLILNRGWNWVGFNVLPMSRTVGDVLGTTVFTVNDIIQTNGGSARFTGTSWTPANFTIEYGKLYQIYVANAVTVNISGEPCPLWCVPLTAGWNWIANLTQHSVTPSELAHNGGWTENDRIQTAGGNSVAYINGKWVPSTGLSLEPGKGYQIYSANDGALAFPSEEDDDELYVVVDLSGGTDATNYPVRYTNNAPNLNDDTCRTTELWLRKIPTGTFIMGSPEDEVGRKDNETLHEVTFTQDYYIGVFECTQKQWELVMGSTPSEYTGDCRPVEGVSYDIIRGTGAKAGAGWPTYGHTVDASSFMGILQMKTGLIFDLPTEAQWEYACRAGTTTALNSGKNLTSTSSDANMAEVGRYRYNQSDGKGGYSQHTTVGSYLPNAWGLYDMHGNVWEWCLDWWGASTTSTEVQTDPSGPDTGSNRVLRGGGRADYAYGCRSAHRYSFHPSDYYGSGGFRVLCLPRQDLYAVVDLSGGPDATNYPVRYTNKPPNLNDDTCRTTELWLRKIPAGTFIMGSPEDEEWRQSDETQHEVTLTKDYYLGVFECTQRQWELVMGNKPSRFNNVADYAVRPVEYVSFNEVRGTPSTIDANGHIVDVTSFFGKLQVKTGLVFDLPTEAQWEYAARGGDKSSGYHVFSGGDDLDLVAWHGENSNDSTHPVGQKQANELGLYDMSGNVRELCVDSCNYNDNDGIITDTYVDGIVDPYCRIGSYHIGRGGTWSDDIDGCTVADRYYAEMPNHYDCLGFRVALHPQQDLYAVVDLSDGPEATNYPVRYSSVGPNLDDDTCRTTELWLRRIPAGTFTMGSPEGELGRDNDRDMAQHEVTLTQDYYIGVFECTQKQWELVMGANPSYFNNTAYYATRPVEMVYYNIIRGTSVTAVEAGWPTYGHNVGSTSFMGKLQAKTGLTFDLPTEAQWEYACRAGTTTALNSGKNLTNTGQDANMAEVGRYYYNGGSVKSQNCDPTNGTAKVGSYLPNGWGLYDMHGNVDEWCLDWYGASTSSMEAETDPTGPNTGTFRVLRSGCYSFPAHTSRAASRSYNGLSATTSSYGFRVSCLP